MPVTGIFHLMLHAPLMRRLGAVCEGLQMKVGAKHSLFTVPNEIKPYA